MFFVTLRVLMFRYVYILRERWLLTVSYLLFPLTLCFLSVWSFSAVEIVQYERRIQEHDERSFLRIPETDQCSSSEPNDCTLEIVVCPDFAEQRNLMDEVGKLLTFHNKTSALVIRYVSNPEQMTDILEKLEGPRSPWGLHFHEVTRTKLEYTIRPPAPFIPPIRYDWSGYATTKKFPSPMSRGPRLTDPYFTIIKNDISLVGLLNLQVAVDKAYVESTFPNVSKEWLLTSFPYPPYFEVKDEYRDNLSHRFYLIFVQYMLMMGITFMLAVFASRTINDKRSGTLEWLYLNGAYRWMVDLSWLVSFGFEATILAFCEVGLLKMPTTNGPTIKYMSASVLMLVLITYNRLSLCWVYLLATILKSKIICILLTMTCWMISPVLQWIPPDRFVMQGLLATLPNAGMVLIFKSFQEFDGAETVLGFDSLSKYPIHYLPVGYLLLIMVSTSVLLILLSTYVDLVSPGFFGRAKPWHLFTVKEQIPLYGAPQNNEQYFEEISNRDAVGLECVRITKFFRKKKIPCHYTTAVQDVSMKIPKNKTTVILGLNGAGKTTLLSILCGLYSPSGGHFYCEGFDVFQGNNISKFRKTLGYCPQSNLLMNELTVKQHLVIFGLLKGLSWKKATENCEKWTERFKMENFENTRADNLSGGTKRKLCLAIAMTGDHHYLMLDDPSSGLDSSSLRKFWSLLLQEKGKCTVVLTTHNMEEAEILGDQIAIMGKGQLKAYGSSSFLKQKLEAEYKLNITGFEKKRDRVIRCVRNFDNSITIRKQTRNSVTFGIPINKSKSIPDLMKQLESDFGDGIAKSVSYGAMDDIFGKFFKVDQSKASNDVNGLGITESDIARSSNYLLYLCAIFGKRMEWICNQSLITAMLLLLVIPIIGIYLTVHFMNESIGFGSSSNLTTASLKLTMDVYKEKIAFISRRTNAITSALREALRTSGIKSEHEVYMDMVDFLRRMAKKDLFEYRSKMVFAFDGGDNVSDISTAYYSRNSFHSAPIAYSALINAIIPDNATIITHNHPYAKGSSCSGASPSLITLYFQIILGPILLITASFFVILPHIERKTLFKHLQLMTRLPPGVYWLSNFIFDMLIFSISFLLIIIILATMNGSIFLYPSVMLAVTVVLLLYGSSAIVFSYTFSFCRCSTSIIVTFLICIPPLFLLGYFVLKDGPVYLRFLFQVENLYFLPWVILTESLQKISIRAGTLRACHQCKEMKACESILTHSLLYQLKTELLSFVMISLVYFTFIIAMDHGFGKKLENMIDQILDKDVEESQEYIDQEVENEKRQVRNLLLDEEEYQPELVCEGLGKTYPSQVTAVQGVTFAHDRGSVLGILGSNGAGISTLLGMLSAVISSTKGSATVRGKRELSDCESKYMRYIGYCPQFGGILPGLTGRSTLLLFGRLRGFKSSVFLNSHVERWLTALDMMYLADRPCEGYSNGNKKKLSFAIAMIGFPTLVLLDEPTVGNDSVIHKRIWDILHLSRRYRYQAMILASHTLSDCEAICDRVTILINGEMCCLSSVPNLKSTYGKSCILHVKLQDNTTPDQVKVILQKLFRQSQFSRFAKLQEKRINFLVIMVKTEKIKTYEVFAEMSKIKDENSAIDDFFLSEMPLEEDFTSFSQQTKSTSQDPRTTDEATPTQPEKAQKR